MSRFYTLSGELIVDKEEYLRELRIRFNSRLDNLHIPEIEARSDATLRHISDKIFELSMPQIVPFRKSRR
ncbi:MAG: hypothetical protein UW63_C0043G0022 [Candidatus Uhrbacteria bacterium GW2011_GWF2_44_350]|uniref:Uncharacterized protein n=1 Tax=Candidatus Uhrbacteria bacterium GW2011_GWF2_44_350 TaxID=1619000 RepID=A0A0G1LMA8_9BACT|nr:MAG: hypothetical protein UW63_C0043G0022 [Candidatus Uhrbacteria bacterium GW2011_GWF2_44_350]